MSYNNTLQWNQANTKGGEHSDKTYKTPLKATGTSPHSDFDGSGSFGKTRNQPVSLCNGTADAVYTRMRIYSAVQQMWTSVAILVVLEILCVVAMFFAVVIETTLDGMKDSLVGFVHS